MFFGKDNSVTEVYIPTTTNATETEEEAYKAYQATDAATLPVLIVIIVVITIFAVAVFAYLKIRNRRMADKLKSVQLRMSTTDNAGVYVDLSPPEPCQEGTGKRRSLEL